MLPQKGTDAGFCLSLLIELVLADGQARLFPKVLAEALATLKSVARLGSVSACA